MIARLATVGGMRLSGGTPQAYGHRIHSDIAQGKQTVKDANITPE